MFTHVHAPPPPPPTGASTPSTRQPSRLLPTSADNRFRGSIGSTQTALSSETLVEADTTSTTTPTTIITTTTTTTTTESAPGLEHRGGNESDEGLFFMTSAPSSRSSPRSPGRPATHTPAVRAPGKQPSSPPPAALPDPSRELHTAGTAPNTSPPTPSRNATQPPRFYIVPDQPAAFRVESVELLLQIIIEPYLRKAPGFSRLLEVWSRGLVVQSLVEFEARGAAVWLGTGGSDSLLECTGLAQAVVEGRRFRGSKVTNITVGGLQGALCDWLLQCPAGFHYRRFNHFDELSGRFWLRSAAGSADSLDNQGFTRSDELLHMRALDRTCCYHDDTLSLASTCPSNGARIRTVFPHSSQYGWRGSEVSMVDCVLDSGKASDLSVCSWPVEPIHWTPYPLLQQLASHRPSTVRATRTRSYCEGMELVDMGKSWTA
ncbi:hypothetical protein CRUP_034656 [Coryphaenoides rupestris]|nr:hypothetical protein CRUP_034656 [Coryphaenoides rupestris]